MEGLELALWKAIVSGPYKYGRLQLTGEQIERLQTLSDRCGGWVRFDDDDEETFVSLEDWKGYATLGPQKADELLRVEIAIAVPKHQGEWNRNLAQAWAPLMTPEEFDSVVLEKQKSPFASKFVSLQDRAGATMKVNSEPLLKTVLTEVLTGVFEKSMPK